MASKQDLFGNSSFGEKRPPAPKFPEPGVSVDYIIVTEPTPEQQKQVGGSWEPQWLEKQADDKWKVKTTSELTEGSERSALMQIVFTAQLLSNGEMVTIYLDNKIKKEAFEEAMDFSGLDVGPGTGVRQTRLKNVGKQFGWAFKFAAPKVKTEKAE